MMGGKKRNGTGSTGRDRQRQYMERLRQNAEKYEEFKTKERLRYHANAAKKKTPSDREVRNQRKRWRVRQKKSRKKKQESLENIRRIELDTPPGSPEPRVAHASPPSAGPSSSQKERGRKQIRRDRSTLVRRVKALEASAKQERRRAERYKKRLQRLQKQYKVKTVFSTPQKDAQEIIGQSEIPKK